MDINAISGQPGAQGQYPINMFFDPEYENGRAALVGRSGLRPWFDSGVGGEVRGLHKFGNYVYAVIGDTVYRVDKYAGKLALSVTLNTSTGPVEMADNGTQIMIIDSTYGYIVASDAVTVITDSDFPTPSSLTYADGYFIVSEKDTQKFYISASYNGLSWDGTDFASAEGSPDNIVSLLIDHRELFIFGTSTVEVWYNSGAAAFPYTRIQGAFAEKGCSAAKSPAKIDNTVFFLTNERQVVRMAQYTPAIISTREIERQISDYDIVSDAIGIARTQGGHSLYTLIFPSAGKTWEYDVSSGLWHELSSYVETVTTQGRFRGNCHAFFDGYHVFGDYRNGRIYRSDSEYYMDNGEELRRVRTVPPIIAPDRVRSRHDLLEIEFKSGTGINGGDDPQAMLDWSDDGGKTWSNEHWRGIGKIGKYKDRSRWFRLGLSRDRTYRIAFTDPNECVIISANISASPGGN